MEPPAQAWRNIAERAKDSVPHRKTETQEVVSGLRETSIEEATRLALKYPNNPIIQAMLQAQESVGGDTSRLKKLLAYRRGLNIWLPVTVGISNTGKVFDSTHRVPPSEWLPCADAWCKLIEPIRHDMADNDWSISKPPVPADHHRCLQGRPLQVRL